METYPGNSNDIHRIFELSQKLQEKTATKIEKDEYMNLLLKNNSITRKQYEDYRSGRNTDDLVEAAMTIGGIFLLGYLISKLIK